MCGGFFWRKKKRKKVEEELNIHESLNEDSMEGDISPGTSPIIITKSNNLSVQGNNDIEIINMFWGIPSKDNKLIINARSESVLEKPLFYEGIRNNRCVIPAIHFYEWDKDKIKVTFSKKDNSIFYLAGFYLKKGNKNFFVILTTKANNSVIDVHPRMPLFFETSQVKDWICGNSTQKYLNLQMPELDSYQSRKQLTLW